MCIQNALEARVYHLSSARPHNPDLFFARLDTGTTAILEHTHNTWQTLHQRNGVLDIPVALCLCVILIPSYLLHLPCIQTDRQTSKLQPRVRDGCYRYMYVYIYS